MLRRKRDIVGTSGTVVVMNLSHHRHKLQTSRSAQGGAVFRAKDLVQSFGHQIWHLVMMVRLYLRLFVRIARIRLA